jgi:hypothetical protein
LKLLLTLRPQKKKGDPTVTDICCLKYADDVRIYFKTDDSGAWEELRRKRSVTFYNSLDNLYVPNKQTKSKVIHL